MADVKVADLVEPVKKAPGLHYKNPRVPVHIKLPAKFEYGTKIYIHGCVADKPNRFAFNMKTAETKADDYFHFNPRFDKGYVVRNTRVNGAWGKEEREGGMPFTPGQPFLITVTPTEKNYQVEVNGSLFITFNNRDGMPLSDVTHLGVWGDLTVYGVHLLYKNMPTPMSLRIPIKLLYGDMLTFNGTVPKSAKRFQVNFQSGPGEDAKVIYSFSPRFEKKEIIYNSRGAGSIDKEVVIKDESIKPGAPVKVRIIAADEGFIPYVDDNKDPLPTFPHRLNVSDASYAVFSGDISLETVTIDCAPVSLPAQNPDVDIDTVNEKTVQAVQVTTPVDMPLPGELGPGQGVYLNGKVPDSPSGFQINLKGNESDSDIPVQIQSSPDSTPVLNVNSRTGGKWKNEFQTANPIAPGSEVDVFIVCEDTEYVCRVNGDVVGRIPRSVNSGKVTHVSVDGCIDVQRLCGIC